MSHFQFESCIDDCLDKFSAALTRVTTPRWQKKRKNSTTSLPLSPYNANRSLRTPCKTPKRKTPLKTPKSKRTPYKSPSKTTPHVDRFIPNRTAMDNDKNYFQIVNKEDTERKVNELSPDALEKVHYEKAVKENLEEETCDSRILHFKQRAPVAPEGRYCPVSVCTVLLVLHSSSCIWSGGGGTLISSLDKGYFIFYH